MKSSFRKLDERYSQKWACNANAKFKDYVLEKSFSDVCICMYYICIYIYVYIYIYRPTNSRLCTLEGSAAVTRGGPPISAAK